MALGLKDCKAFIAGASKGLGKACAKALADEGARVFVCSRNTEELKRAAAEFNAAGYSAADVSRAAEVKRVVAEAIAALGGLDCLVTNAGGPPTASFEKAGDGDWDYCLPAQFDERRSPHTRGIAGSEGFGARPHRQPD